MKSVAFLLAQLNTNETASTAVAKKLELAEKPDQSMVLLLVLLGIILAVFGVAYVVYRKSHRRGLARSPHPPSFTKPSPGKTESPAPIHQRHRRRRRRRHEHRPRNPTLAETGGLPPVRPKDQPPPPI